MTVPAGDLTDGVDALDVALRRLVAEQACRDLCAHTPGGWRIRRREAWFTLFQDGTVRG